ncbi:MAG: M23 family metallopeptidase [Lachnospiraceae bacterium]|nr:M23 family metallopeptidase [Lachnospiraceae bacterium]
MKILTKKRKFTYIWVSFFTLFVCALFLDGYPVFRSEGENFFHVYLNGVEMGTVGDRGAAEQMLLQARKEIAGQSDDIVFVDADLRLVGEEIFWGEIDAQEDVYAHIKAELAQSVRKTLHRAYTLKVNEYMVNLGSTAEVQELLQDAVDKYATEDIYNVDLLQDTGRDIRVLTADVVRREDAVSHKDEAVGRSGGIDRVMSAIDVTVFQEEDKEFDAFELGLKSVDFAEEVEIAEVYLAEEQISSLEEAVDDVIKEQETVGEYTVVSGDTLSEIAIKVNIPMDRIVELNSDKLENESSMIRVGEKLVITIPEPELSVVRTEDNYFEEAYDADVIYIENNEWYTNQSVVHQQPSAGFRKAIVRVNYLNDTEVSREILKEEVVMEAVPRIVERGTKIPPTYIKPISGGRLSSGFGARSAPTKGASTYHKGVDWATPTGTAVYASCGGTVSKAGWGSGYGYVVYIDHEDGRQTRYGHLSKVLVKAGQKVKQGEKIALSGSTGISTGPHLHFEILIGGSQVNPLKYLN